MKIDILGSFGGNARVFKLTSFLVDDFLALDAGCLTNSLSLERQYGITDVLLSHSHSDHTNTLPFLIDNQFGMVPSPLNVWASQQVIDVVKTHIFNDVVWPDFTRLPSEDSPAVVFHPLKPEEPFRLGHLVITPVQVNHIVPCFAFFLECRRSDATFLFTGDTTSTDRVWEIANARPNLKCVVVDCSFPNRMESLAQSSGHNTPALLKQDLFKLKTLPEVLVYHVKPSFQDEIMRELDDCGIAGLRLSRQGETLEF